MILSMNLKKKRILINKSKKNMLSRDCRLRLTGIVCRIRLHREVSLEDMIWYNELIKNDEQAEFILESFIK